MGAPWNPGIDRYDFAAAVLGDIACALYRNYRKLTELTAYEKTYIRGCGGGFQSDFLCQMLADLTGKDLMLPNGFEQASLLGCVKFLNRFFNVSSEESGNIGNFYTYHPSDKSFSKEYYRKWNEIQEVVCN